MSSCDLSPAPKCESCVLNILRTHLMKVDGSELEYSQVQQLLTQFREALNKGGMISLARNGQVQFITQRAEQLLSEYFSLYATTPSLPPPLQKWFKHQISQIIFNEDDPCLCSTLHIEQSEKQLIVRFIPDPIRGHYLLLLEERVNPFFSIAALELLGLTKREAEVLFWVSKDKTNAEIANVLGCHEGTIRKHLEHIYKKLGIQTRMGAVMAALEKLGLLKG